MMVPFCLQIGELSRGLFSYIPVNIQHILHVVHDLKLQILNFEPQSHGGLDGSDDFLQKNRRFLGEPFAVKTHPGERGNSRHMFRFVSRRFFIEVSVLTENNTRNTKSFPKREMFQRLRGELISGQAPKKDWT